MKHLGHYLGCVAMAAFAMAACGNDVIGESPGNQGGATGGGGQDEVPDSEPVSCFGEPPVDAPLPPAIKPYSGGACPTLQAGDNQIDSGGATRDFILALPSDLDPAEQLPVVFLWHWMGGDMHDFYERGDVQTAVDALRFAAVIPDEKGDLNFKWPFDIAAPADRLDEELTFFDDLLSCVAEQVSINQSCVASAGVSAGALWTPVLAAERGDYLSSIVSLSGGSGGFIKPWAGSPKKMPALVLWGGETDNCLGVMDFVTASHALETGLTQDGHFLVECVHNCGHAPPPFAAPGAVTDFQPMWDFILSHPYWLAPGQSPLSEGLPDTMPEWCGIGMGSAVPRVGECSDPASC